MVKKIAAAVGVLALVQASLGQERVSVTAEVSPQRIYLGDLAVLRIRIEGIAQPAPPEVPATADYEVRFHGGSQSTSSFSFSINGRTVRSSASTAFTYTLLPRRAGRIIIPAVAIEHDGREYSSQPTPLEVIEPAQQDHVFLEVKTDRNEYWIEQPVTAEVIVWVRRLQAEGRALDVDPLLLRDPPELSIPWLDALEGTETVPEREFLPDYYARNRPGFAVNGLTTGGSFFFSRDRTLIRFMFPRSKAKRRGLDGQEHEYYVYRFRKRYLALEAGPLTFSPVRLKGEMPVEVTQDLRIRRTERVLAFSKPVVVTIKPVPTEGRPDSYCGAVGKVDLRVTAKPTKVSVGDPITLTMRLSGKARLESVGAPPLLVNEALARYFKVPEDPLGGVMEGRSKVFTQTIRARSDRVAEIPPLEVSYFDPDSGGFETVRSRPIPLSVHPASLVSTEDVIGFGEDPLASKLTTLTGGLQANYTDVDALLATQQAVWSWRLLGGPLAGPLAFVCVWLVKLRRDRLAGDVAYARRQRAYRNAMRRLSGVSARDRAADDIAACLLDYMADRCDRGGGSVTRQEAADLLRQGGVSEEVLDRLDAVLESCELARYAQMDGSGGELADSARRCLKELEKCRL